MDASHDRDDLEQRTVAAHGLYIEALALTERLKAEVDDGAAGITESNVIQAECLLAERRSRLMELLNTLGYMPKGFTARLPRTPGKGGRRLDATSDPDLAALRRSYLEWKGRSDSVDTSRSAHTMMNLGRILTLLGALPDEDESAEEPGGAIA